MVDDFLTTRQAEVLSAIAQEVTARGEGLSMGQVLAVMGVRSKATGFTMVQRLARHGLVHFPASKHHLIRPTEKGLQLLAGDQPPRTIPVKGFVTDGQRVVWL